eukprot:CAMPEP_0179920772 /NCGR_PEP_ID=MMETSP0983-20121128/4712_1 /TAXON_ID=483367 /ORGANISM="non described non described, Strain CCMP 2436" /LENGTH=31 /DNA_ID= /DNA_START= /DNA_END= /DNA_ORIENTATION=
MTEYRKAESIGWSIESKGALQYIVTKKTKNY